MTIVALGNALTAQARNLAVEGIKERFCLVRVTAPTLLHHQGAESHLFRAHDRMRGMTVFAGGLVFVGDRIIRPVNTLPELFLDTVMASPAGSRNIRRVNSGLRVLRGHFGMRTVAISTGCSNDKTALN